MPNLHTLHPERQFTQISHEAADQLPSMNGLGYLVHLLRHQDGYLPNLDKLVEQKPGVTRRDASKARAEVMEHGFYVSVRFKHSAGGQFETDIWRSVYPHTVEDLDKIAQRYQPGNVTQIAQKGAGKKVQRDAHGNVLMQQVTIQWARVDSWRGQQRVADGGQLCPPDSGGTESGNSARPAKTRESPGGSGIPDSGGPGARGVGERRVLRTPPENTTGEHQEQEPSLRSGSLWVAKSPSVPSRNARDRDEPTSAHSTGEQSNDGRTDATGTISTNPSKNRDPKWEQADWPTLLHEDEINDALKSNPGFKRSQVAQLAKFVARSVAEHGEPAVRGYLLDVCGVAATTTFVFDAFSAERWNDPQDVEEVERWDVRQARAAEAEAQRQQEQARINQTRAEQQRVYEAELDRRQADQLAARRPQEQAPESDHSPQGSPVSWLSDDQFEKLSPQDKAHVRNAGETPSDQLRPATAKRVAAIQRALDGVAA